MLVIPASKETYLKALDEGLIKIFIEAGALVSSPCCGPCLGGHTGIIGPGETSLSTSNRNFKGRQGSPEGEVYLCSAKVAAKSAIEAIKYYGGSVVGVASIFATSEECDGYEVNSAFNPNWQSPCLSDNRRGQIA